MGVVVSGEVVAGQQLGRRLGFPTANIAVTESLTAADGVYAVRVTVGGRSFKGVANLGKNPSVGGCRRRLEVHILDFADDLYGRKIEVELLKKLRDEVHFGSLEELRRQIEIDCMAARKMEF